MEPIAAKDFEQALRECASEPIHQIGHVQPHAGLLAFEPDGAQRVLQASANIENFVGLPLPAVLGRPVAELIGSAASLTLDGLVGRVRELGQPATGRFAASVHGAAVPLIAHLYPAGGLFGHLLALLRVRQAQGPGAPRAGSG